MGKAKHPHNAERPTPLSVQRALEAQDIDALKSALTVRQQHFAEEYVVDFKGKEAAIRAGYSPKWADRQAHILLKHEGVRAYIDHLSLSVAAQAVSVDPEYVIQRITAIIDKDGAKDNDRLRGLELLARYLGMFIEKQEITGKDGGPLSIEQKQKIERDANDVVHVLQGLRKKAANE